MTIKVINTGFSRTGRNSIKEALEILGFPCFHMLGSKFPRQIGVAHFGLMSWIAKTGDYEAYFEELQATIDWPSLTPYKELITLYPEAKVIHSLRPWPPMSFSVRERVRNHRKMVDQLIWEHDFDGRFEEKDYAISKMHEHLQI
ncbi:hypothetical protein BZG36_05246, partial [Bifiguratus adelaidae]